MTGGLKWNSFSMTALKIFRLPFFFPSEFANSSPVEGISEGTLQMTFLELRQV